MRWSFWLDTTKFADWIVLLVAFVQIISHEALFVEKGTVQAKKRHLGSVFAFHIGIILSLLNVPSNCTRQALLVVYSPSAVRRQRISSCIVGSRLVSRVASQRVTYSTTSTCVFSGMMWSIHLSPSSAYRDIFPFCLSIEGWGEVSWGCSVEPRRVPESGCFAISQSYNCRSME